LRLLPGECLNPLLSILLWGELITHSVAHHRALLAGYHPPLRRDSFVDHLPLRRRVVVDPYLTLHPWPVVKLLAYLLTAFLSLTLSSTFND
jgi:hypothetical protein